MYGSVQTLSGIGARQPLTSRRRRLRSAAWGFSDVPTRVFMKIVHAAN